MALGEEQTEVDSAKAKAPPHRRWGCREPEVDAPGPASQEQPLCLEAEGGPTSPAWESEGPPAPARTSAAYPPQTIAASTGTADLLHAIRSQVEETKPSASQAPLPSVNVSRTTALCSGHDADTEDDPSPAALPRVRGLGQQPPASGSPCPTQWPPVVHPCATAPPLSSGSVSASSTGSSRQGCQEVEARSGSLTRAASLELAVPQGAPSLVGSVPRFQWAPRSVASGGDGAGHSRRRLSFQAEYWACVLPDSLPPSPDRHSPLWNPDKEYEDLLDYTYPLRPGPRLPKRLEGHVLADPVLQDSGVDLDSFSVSPASTLRSPTNVSPNCPTAFSGPGEPGLHQWPSGVPQKQGSVGVASCSRVASTPRTPGSRDTPGASRETARRGAKDWLPVGKHPEEGCPQLRTRDRGWPSPRLERERASPSVLGPAHTQSGWKSEEVESDDEYLALPTRLTQVSGLVSYLGVIPTLVTLPAGAAEGQSSLEVSDSDGPASFPSDSSRSGPPAGAALRDSEGQSRCCRHGVVRAQDPAGAGSLVSSQAPGARSGLLKTRSSLPGVLDRWPFSHPEATGQLPGKAGEQGRESLVQCVQTFCCQLEELICWLYNVTDVTDLGTPSRSSLTCLKSSLQLYRQFKRDIDEHQSLTESVLQKGEILLQCLLDNTPVLKDVLGRIEKQSGELESHADRLYDSILASLDMLAGCTLIPDNKPMAAKERPCEGV